ncbi:hypothetical protein O181_094610 [Austropuccinia psidii MF-1]|uniref:Uncharacterized protein n=1 Tax=Austropuccinia psidii MF-1 TaxID=1389203 RepID=A0A9Q3J2C7_9BASI|nr:hypothetical protein [Austropuccinia psidii MF-1]
MMADLEKEGPVVLTSSNPAPHVAKDKPKGPQKKQSGTKNNQGREKAKPIRTELTHKGTGTPNWSLHP